MTMGLKEINTFFVFISNSLLLIFEHFLHLIYIFLSRLHMYNCILKGI